MEQNLPIMAKKFWSVLRVACSILRKRISQAKLTADFKIYMMLKRGKIGASGKSAMLNLVHHHRTSRHRGDTQVFSIDESAAQQFVDDEMLEAAVMECVNSVAASPAFTELLRTPEFRELATRQMKITDSPSLLRDVEEDIHVDEAAEKFISKFYKQLRQQNSNI